MNPKQSNRIIRTSREGWFLVDISTAKYPDAVMYIDVEDWNYIQSLEYGRIHVIKSNNILYARCIQSLDKGKQQFHSIHRLLLPNSKMIDHENRNGLDNRRKNIRSCTRTQNQMNRKIPTDNTSGIKGVSWSKRFKKWIVFISINKGQKILGKFSTIEEAAEVRQVAEKKYYGEFACDS